MQALLDQPNERVVPTELAIGTEFLVHVSHVLTASLELSASYQQPTVLVEIVGRKRIAGEDFADSENGDNSKRENINAGAVLRLFSI